MNIEAFFTISYGLYIISTKNNGKLNGYIGNTMFQVTAEPPQIAISCNKDNYSEKMIEESGIFSVSVLKQETNPELIGLFGYNSGKEKNKFEKVKYITGKTGAPIVTEDCVAWLECEVVDRFEVGTHIIIVGKVIDGDVLEDSDPLTYKYYREVKKGLAPKNAPTYIDKEKIKEKKKEQEGELYKCAVCGHIYNSAEGDEASGIPPGTPFDELPDDWQCPICGAMKSDFYKMDD